MPTPIKIFVSLLALCAAAGMFYYDTVSGTEGFVRWIPLFLGPFAVFSIWVFPEAKAKEIRKEAARRRAET